MMVDIKETRRLLTISLDIASKQNKKIQEIVDAQYELLKGITKAIQKTNQILQDYIKQEDNLTKGP